MHARNVDIAAAQERRAEREGGKGEKGGRERTVAQLISSVISWSEGRRYGTENFILESSESSSWYHHTPSVLASCGDRHVGACLRRIDRDLLRSFGHLLHRARRLGRVRGGGAGLLGRGGGGAGRGRRRRVLGRFAASARCRGAVIR
eukprot:3740352-Rhodomonas_salina.1